jgi:hypothetical protein
VAAAARLLIGFLTAGPEIQLFLLHVAAHFTSIYIQKSYDNKNFDRLNELHQY